MEPPPRVEDWVDRPIPDLELPSAPDGTFRLRGFVGVSPLVLFFYLRDGTPG
jgi:peroxiredoxin